MAQRGGMQGDATRQNVHTASYNLATDVMNLSQYFNEELKETQQEQFDDQLKVWDLAGFRDPNLQNLERWDREELVFCKEILKKMGKWPDDVNREKATTINYNFLFAVNKDCSDNGITFRQTMEGLSLWASNMENQTLKKKFLRSDNHPPDSFLTSQQYFDLAMGFWAPRTKLEDPSVTGSPQGAVAHLETALNTLAETELNVMKAGLITKSQAASDGSGVILQALLKATTGQNQMKYGQLSLGILFKLHKMFFWGQKAFVCEFTASKTTKPDLQTYNPNNKHMEHYFAFMLAYSLYYIPPTKDEMKKMMEYVKSKADDAWARTLGKIYFRNISICSYFQGMMEDKLNEMKSNMAIQQPKPVQGTLPYTQIIPGNYLPNTKIISDNDSWERVDSLHFVTFKQVTAQEFTPDKKWGEVNFSPEKAFNQVLLHDYDKLFRLSLRHYQRYKASTQTFAGGGTSAAPSEPKAKMVGGSSPDVANNYFCFWNITDSDNVYRHYWTAGIGMIYKLCLKMKIGVVRNWPQRDGVCYIELTQGQLYFAQGILDILKANKKFTIDEMVYNLDFNHDDHKIHSLFLKVCIKTRLLYKLTTLLKKDESLDIKKDEVVAEEKEDDFILHEDKRCPHKISMMGIPKNKWEELKDIIYEDVGEAWINDVCSKLFPTMYSMVAPPPPQPHKGGSHTPKPPQSQLEPSSWVVEQLKRKISWALIKFFAKIVQCTKMCHSFAFSSAFKPFSPQLTVIVEQVGVDNGLKIKCITNLRGVAIITEVFSKMVCLFGNAIWVADWQIPHIDFDDGNGEQRGFAMLFLERIARKALEKTLIQDDNKPFDCPENAKSTEFINRKHALDRMCYYNDQKANNDQKENFVKGIEYVSYLAEEGRRKEQVQNENRAVIAIGYRTKIVKKYWEENGPQRNIPFADLCSYIPEKLTDFNDGIEEGHHIMVNAKRMLNKEIDLNERCVTFNSFVHDHDVKKMIVQSDLNGEDKRLLYDSIIGAFSEEKEKSEKYAEEANIQEQRAEQALRVVDARDEQVQLLSNKAIDMQQDLSQTREVVGDLNSTVMNTSNLLSMQNDLIAKLMLGNTNEIDIDGNKKISPQEFEKYTRKLLKEANLDQVFPDYLLRMIEDNFMKKYEEKHQQEEQQEDEQEELWRSQSPASVGFDPMELGDPKERPASPLIPYTSNDMIDPGPEPIASDNEDDDSGYTSDDDNAYSNKVTNMMAIDENTSKKRRAQERAQEGRRLFQKAIKRARLSIRNPNKARGLIRNPKKPRGGGGKRKSKRKRKSNKKRKKTRKLVKRVTKRRKKFNRKRRNSRRRKKLRKNKRKNKKTRKK